MKNLTTPIAKKMLFLHFFFKKNDFKPGFNAENTGNFNFRNNSKFFFNPNIL